jgi:hypothetical protein
LPSIKSNGVEAIPDSSTTNEETERVKDIELQKEKLESLKLSEMLGTRPPLPKRLKR